MNHGMVKQVINLSTIALTCRSMKPFYPVPRPVGWNWTSKESNTSMQVSPAWCHQALPQVMPGGRLGQSCETPHHPPQPWLGGLHPTYPNGISSIRVYRTVSWVKLLWAPSFGHSSSGEEPRLGEGAKPMPAWSNGRRTVEDFGPLLATSCWA